MPESLSESLDTTWTTLPAKSAHPEFDPYTAKPGFKRLEYEPLKINKHGVQTAKTGCFWCRSMDYGEEVLLSPQNEIFSLKCPESKENCVYTIIEAAGGEVRVEKQTGIHERSLRVRARQGDQGKWRKVILRLPHKLGDEVCSHSEGCGETLFPSNTGVRDTLDVKEHSEADQVSDEIPWISALISDIPRFWSRTRDSRSLVAYTSPCNGVTRFSITKADHQRKFADRCTAKAELEESTVNRDVITDSPVFAVRPQYRQLSIIDTRQGKANPQEWLETLVKMTGLSSVEMTTHDQPAFVGESSVCFRLNLETNVSWKVSF